MSKKSDKIKKGSGSIIEEDWSNSKETSESEQYMDGEEDALSIFATHEFPPFSNAQNAARFNATSNNRGNNNNGRIGENNSAIHAAMNRNGDPDSLLYSQMSKSAPVHGNQEDEEVNEAIAELEETFRAFDPTKDSKGDTSSGSNINVDHQDQDSGIDQTGSAVTMNSLSVREDSRGSKAVMTYETVEDKKKINNQYSINNNKRSNNKISAGSNGMISPQVPSMTRTGKRSRRNHKSSTNVLKVQSMEKLNQNSVNTSSNGSRRSDTNNGSGIHVGNHGHWDYEPVGEVCLKIFFFEVLTA